MYLLDVLMYIFIYVWAKVTKKIKIKNSHPRRGDRWGQETFLTPSADRQTRKNTEYWKHHPFQLLQGTGTEQ